MIEITTNGNFFWPQVNNESQAIIYGAGTNGEILGNLLQKSKIPFYCYMDIKGCIDIPKTLLSKKIFHPSQIMKEYKPKKYLIVISALSTLDCIREIESCVENALVLIAPKMNAGCSFDSILSFCRHKLLKKTDFTILSNNCLGGRFYGITNCELRTPTINIIIEPADYVKFCSNLRYYLKQSFKFLEYSDWRYDRYHPIGTLDDIKVHFLGYKTYEEGAEAWERRKSRVNFDNLFMIFDSTHYQPTLQQYKDFLKIPYGKKLIFQRSIGYSIEHSIHSPYGFHPFDDSRIIEEYFDLTGWLNGEVEY